MKELKSVCVFCGSSTGNNQVIIDSAKRLGLILAEQNIKLVYGGAKVGLMGIIADTVIENKGKVTGVIPDFFSKKEIAHENLNELIYVKSMAERKAVLAELSDAFIAMPGGYGTMDELFEMLTVSQLDLHRKPIGLLNVDNFFEPLLKQLERMMNDNFLQTAHRNMLLEDEEPETLLNKLRFYEPPQQDKWINKIKR
jgi:hypothetical protein